MAALARSCARGRTGPAAPGRAPRGPHPERPRPPQAVTGVVTGSIEPADWGTGREADPFLAVSGERRGDLLRGISCCLNGMAN
jgi:hypothetical protein